MKGRGVVLVAALGAALACRGTPPGTQSASSVVDSLVPAVERASGMRFRSAPRVAMRSRQQVRAYLAAKLDDELPAARAAGMEPAYQLFGLLPDSVHLKSICIRLPCRSPLKHNLGYPVIMAPAVPA